MDRKQKKRRETGSCAKYKRVGFSSDTKEGLVTQRFSHYHLVTTCLKKGYTHSLKIKQIICYVFTHLVLCCVCPLDPHDHFAPTPGLVAVYDDVRAPSRYRSAAHALLSLTAYAQLPAHPASFSHIQRIIKTISHVPLHTVSSHMPFV